ncbi:MAG: GNAT family N-acetyltransferase [Anaerolineales bacterium]|jgi:RimJ/RimL family protein N-acetyltransferase|nr:GNAT family N-acetyltransferase [Anaerolineales bacterium]
MTVQFTKLADPIPPEVYSAFTKWENDPALVHLTRLNHNQADIDRESEADFFELDARLSYNRIYLIYLDGQLVGEMSYQIDPQHLYKKEPGTAWIGITIGEEVARGRGIGKLAMQHIEGEIRAAGFKRIELGVFEFNTLAQKLYLKMGYTEIGRIPDFTFWQDKLWMDIRMEKYI